MSENAHDGHEELISPWASRIRAVEELLVEKRVFTHEEIQAQIEHTEARSPANGARLVTRAWTDLKFKKKLLSDPKAACLELGIDASGPVEIAVVENTQEVHNLIVCTLCSCYPRPILGRPPDWYKSFAYRSRAVREPRAVMREFGLKIPDGVEVVVHDSTADLRYMVLPMRPPGTEGLGEEELAWLVSRECLIGAAVPRNPAPTG